MLFLFFDFTPLYGHDRSQVACSTFSAKSGKMSNEFSTSKPENGLEVELFGHQLTENSKKFDLRPQIFDFWRKYVRLQRDKMKFLSNCSLKPARADDITAYYTTRASGKP